MESTPNRTTQTDIFAQCVLDYAHTDAGYPRGPDFLVGSQLYSKEANCSRPFLRSMMEPTADGFRSSGCWHTKFDQTVSRWLLSVGWVDESRGGSSRYLQRVCCTCSIVFYSLKLLLPSHSHSTVS